MSLRAIGATLGTESRQAMNAETALQQWPQLWRKGCMLFSARQTSHNVQSGPTTCSYSQRYSMVRKMA